MDFGFWQYLGIATFVVIAAACADIAIKARAAGLTFGQEVTAIKASPGLLAAKATVATDATALWTKIQTEFTQLHNKLNASLTAAPAQPMAAINATFADSWDIAVAWVKSGDTNGVVLIDATGVRTTPQSGTSPAYEFTAQEGGGYKRTA